MGFRSYVRHFCGAISEPFRPSLPWGFAAGSGSLLGVAARHQQQQQQECQQQQGFRSRDPSFTAMGICRWEWFAFRRRS